MKAQPVFPLLPHLAAGVTVKQVRQLLNKNHCLDFPHLNSGMLPACNFDDLENDTTGMAHAWLRDTAFIAYLLLDDTLQTDAVTAVNGLLLCLEKTAHSYQAVIAAGHAPTGELQRPPISFFGQNSDPRHDWGNDQNDAIGYTMLAIGAAASAQAINLTSRQLQLLQLLPDFLETIHYWQDPDRGHWEEDVRLNASSIGCVVAGLAAAKPHLTDTDQVDRLIHKGLNALHAILPNESVAPTIRAYDAALLFLVEPLHVLSGEIADTIVHNVIDHLTGEFGVRRYLGDSYWAPNWHDHVAAAQKSQDFSVFTDVHKRNSLHKPGGEAQWTLFDPMLSAYYSRRFSVTKDPANHTAAQHYLVRSLKSIISCQSTRATELVWRIPEAYYLDHDTWLPNDHIGLLWSQANLIYALNQYANVFTDDILKYHPADNPTPGK